jgi:hypothetical protein
MKINKWKVFGIIVLVFLCCTVLFCAKRIFSDGAKTIENEFKPSALLKKYEWFKDIAAAIDKKRADIDLYQAELANFKVEDRDDKFYYQQRKSELIGIITVHNDLCSRYNAQMVKMNYAFCNVGQLPATNLEVLPREIKPYINNLEKR